MCSVEQLLQVDEVDAVEQPIFQIKDTTLRVSQGALQQPVELQVYTDDNA